MSVTETNNNHDLSGRSRTSSPNQSDRRNRDTLQWKPCETRTGSQISYVWFCEL